MKDTRVTGTRKRLSVPIFEEASRKDVFVFVWPPILSALGLLVQGLEERPALFPMASRESFPW